MSSEQNKAVVTRMLKAINGKEDPSAIDQIFTEDWQNIDPSLPPLPRGPEGARMHLGLFAAGMPDIELAVEDIIAEGDLVAASFTAMGTHTGELMGIPPTGKKVDITGTGFFKMRDGKIAENRVNFDALGLLQQLGVVPPLGQPIA
jgi:steroid delta-isomerase-like uncharacterized protein